MHLDLDLDIVTCLCVTLCANLSQLGSAKAKISTICALPCLALPFAALPCLALPSKDNDKVTHQETKVGQPITWAEAQNYIRVISI